MMTPMTEEQRAEFLRNIKTVADAGLLSCEDASEIIDVCLRAAIRERAGIYEDMMKTMIEGTRGAERNGEAPE